MKDRIKHYLRIVGLPLLFLCVFLSLWLLWKLLDLPPEEELIERIRIYFEAHGYWIVFVSAIIEGMLLAGWYYPGSLVIFLGVIFAGKNIPEVILVVSLVTAGLFIAYIFNYMIGKYGWYKLLMKFGLKGPIENAQVRLTKYGMVGIFLSYWHPNLAALTSTAAGILGFPFSKFVLYSFTAVTLWNIFWGGLAYFLGEKALGALGMRFVVVVAVIWIGYRLVFKERYVAKENS